MRRHLLSDGFYVAFEMSAPLIVVGLCLYLSSGIMARLMPNMQVFFVVIPMQIMVSFSILLITLGASMMWYIGFFRDTIMTILKLN